MYPETERKESSKKPDALIVNPASEKLERVYKNLEDEPLIDKIKDLEEQFEALLGEESVKEDIEEIADEDEGIKPKAQKRQDPKTTGAEKIEILNQLLSNFNALLKTKYGALGYLVKSNSEDILKIYGIDTDEDYYLDLESSTIRVSSRRLERMVMAGGGKRFIGERGLLLSDPAEVPENAKVTDEVVLKIISRITAMLVELGPEAK